MFMNFIKKIFRKIVYPNTYSEEAYINYLIDKKVLIGKNVKIWSPKNTYIDVTKPYLIKIGDYVKITSGVVILAHDYSHSVLRREFGEFKGGTLPVTIGDNVFIGMNSTILMGTSIGDNCIVGANSLVKGTFPNNSVIAGNPAKIICKTSELWEKVSESWINDAVLVARTIYKNKGNILPTIEEMSDAYAWLYLPREEETIEKYKVFFNLSCDDFEEIKRVYMNSTPVFGSFEEFLDYCELK